MIVVKTTLHMVTLTAEHQVLQSLQSCASGCACHHDSKGNRGLLSFHSRCISSECHRSVMHGNRHIQYWHDLLLELKQQTLRQLLLKIWQTNQHKVYITKDYK